MYGLRPWSLWYRQKQHRVWHATRACFPTVVFVILQSKTASGMVSHSCMACDCCEIYRPYLKREEIRRAASQDYLSDALTGILPIHGQIGRNLPRVLPEQDPSRHKPGQQTAATGQRNEREGEWPKSRPLRVTGKMRQKKSTSYYFGRSYHAY